MIVSIIKEWLTDCAELPNTELSTFVNNLSQDDEIVQALYILLEERSKYSKLVETVCNQLFNFYRSKEIQLQRFSLQFLPTLIYIYLNAVAHGDIKNCRTVETLLLGVYNLELLDKDGQPKAVSFRLPSLAMMSIYHEPSSLAPASLTESAVRRFEECNTKLVSWGPLNHVETLNAQNRLKVMTALLFIFNQHIGFLKKSALEPLCKVASKLITQGFMKPGHHQRSSYGSDSSFVPRLLPRIPVSSQFLLEFLHAIYFAMYNNCWYVAIQAVEDIHNRACYETYPDVMLATNAIRNSSTSGPTGQTSDGPTGISVSSSTSTATILKSMITNASFRTKKLPDDLDEMLFDNGEIKNDQTANESQNHLQSDQSQRTPVNSVRRRAWLWKNQMHNSFDEADITGTTAPPPSIENSRRESICSSNHSSPNRSSPKRGREKRNKDGEKTKSSKKEGKKIDDSIKDKSEGAVTQEVKNNSAQRLYKVLEEQVFGEAVSRLNSSSSMKNKNQQLNFCTTPEETSTDNSY